MNRRKLAQLSNSPAGIVIVVAAIALAFEYPFMALVHEVLVPALPFELSHNVLDIVDAVTISAILVSALYFLVFRRLRDDEERLRNIYFTTLNAIVIIDAAGRITEWNPAAESMFQFSREEALGRPLYQLIVPPRQREEAARGFSRFEQSGEGPVIGRITELAALRKDGVEFPVELSISAAKLKGRWHAIGVIRDISERKQAETALRESEAIFRVVFEGALDGIALADARTRKLAAGNAALCRMLGYSREELTRIGVADIHPQQDLPKVIDQFEMQLRGEIDIATDIPVKRKDGTVFYADIKSGAVRMGDKDYVLGIFRDVTERKQAEQTLQASESRFRALTENISDLTTLLGRDGVVGYHSPSVERLTGYAAGELYGRSVFEFIHPEDRERTRAALEAALAAAGTVQSVEHRLRHKDGSWKAYESKGSYQPAMNAIVVSSRDVTERNETMEKLREARDYLENLLNHANAPVVVWDPAYQITLFNHAFERLTGRRADEVVGKHIGILFPAGAVDAAMSYVDLTKTGKRWETVEIPIAHASGEVKTVLWNSATLYSADGTYVIATIAQGQDITERKRMEAEVQREQSRLKAILQTAGDGIHILDADCLLVDASDSFLQMLGYDQSAIGRVHAYDWDLQLAEETIRGNIAKLIASRGSMLVETRQRRADGRIIDVEVNASGFESGGQGYVCATSRDITERKRREREKAEADIRLRQALTDAIGAIAATLEQRDPYTAGHQRRVAQLAVAIGEEMGLARGMIDGLHFGGLIHDIGKISVPAEILSKPGDMTELEYQMVKTHPEAGYQIVKDIAFPWPVAAMVHQHHERLDGSGYPQGLKGEEIALEARILAVADVIEAMSSHRPYRPGLGIDKALTEIERGRGSAYDGLAVDACLKLFREKEYAIPA